MTEVTPAELREIEDSHFMAIAQALISGASNNQCEAVKNLLFWRQRELKQEMVRRFNPGEEIRYLLADSKTIKIGRIHHLNKMSVSIHLGEGRYEAVPIERVIGQITDVQAGTLPLIEGPLYPGRVLFGREK